MKRFISVCVFFTLLSISGYGQNLETINNDLLIGNVPLAKEDLDHLLKNDKKIAKLANNANLPLTEARVYAALYATDATRTQYPNIGDMALKAFQQYLQLDPDAKKIDETKQLPNLGLTVVDNLYITYFNIGRSYIQKENWDSAFQYFQKAAYIGDLITRYNWKNNNQKIDTVTTLLAANCAQQSNLKDSAVVYYSRLANLKIGGPSYQIAYDFLTAYYLTNRNQPMLDKYATVAKTLYPQNTIWGARQDAYVEEYTTLSQKDSLYQLAIKQGNLTANDYRKFGDMFSSVSKEDKDVMDSATIAYNRLETIDAYSKAFLLDTANGLMAYNVGILYYNQFNDIDDKKSAVRRTLQNINEAYQESTQTPNQTKAQKDKNKAEHDQQVAGYKLTIQSLNNEEDRVGNLSIDWLTKSYKVLNAHADNRTREENNYYKQVINFLTNLYDYKRNANKGTNLFDQYDAQYNFYNNQIN
ncbi:MAG: hypothetical protein QM528_05765 [Phycisphaerales bacterium]|nr:hypothetical protein [Phycisphaerales bacterium]